MEFPIESIRNDFPVLKTQINKQPLVYFDNGATAQKPKPVIDLVNDLTANKNSSIHRSVNFLSSQMTDVYEQSRELIRDFLGASSSKEIIFTSGATASINLVASSYGDTFISEGDEILLTTLEHHANIVPWQLLCQRKGAVIKVLPIDEDGKLRMDLLDDLLGPKTRFVAVAHVSNVMGTIQPVKEIIEKAHLLNIPVLVDGAQSVQHGEINVQEMDCDFFVFSGHKVYGPTGVGVLYGKEKYLEAMPPWQGGGDMIDRVSFSGTTFNELPFKFEAGTTNYIGAIGMAEAFRYMQKTGLAAIQKYEQELRRYADEQLHAIPGIRIYGDIEKKSPIFSFLLEGIHPYDTGMVLDKMGIAVRTGTHCAMPLMEHFGIEGTIRASLCFYNTMEEVDKLIEGLTLVTDMFG